MRLPRHPPWPSAILALLLLPACDKYPTPQEPADAKQDAAASTVETSAATQPFEVAQAFFELNTTFHDMGFQVFLDHEGWRHVALFDPDGNRVFGITAEAGLSEIGITELHFESEEPSPAELRPLFPNGQYTFRGETVDGTKLVTQVNVSKQMLPAPTFTPRNGQLVDPANTVVKWETSGAQQVEVIIEQDELGHVLDITLSASTTRLTVPRQFLRPGREYKIEIQAVDVNQNRTIAESTFRTEG